MELRGPCRFNQKQGKFINLKTFEILDASFEISGKVIPLQANNISIERKTDCFFIYHCFVFVGDNDRVLSGTWYISEFPLDSFKKMNKNFLRVIVTNNNNDTGTAIFRVFFTEEVAAELKLID